MQFAGIEGHFLNRKNKRNLFQLSFGNTYRKDKLNTAFTLWNNKGLQEQPDNYQNQTIYQTNDLF